jgi:hypothetical protein
LGSSTNLRHLWTHRNGSHFGAKRCFLAQIPPRQARRASKRFLLKNLLQSSNIGASPVSRRENGQQQQDGGVLEAEKVRLKPPPLFKVLLLNDDYTPMDFVVVVLQTVSR